MPEPLYRRIAEDLRRQIEAGELAEGAQLPTEAELREFYAASRNTVRDAIKWLANLDLVETRPGQGTFVVTKIDPFITTIGPDLACDGSALASEAAAQHREPALSVTQVEIQAASNLLASELRLPEGAQIISRHRRRFIDGRPWSLQTAYFPVELAIRGAQRLMTAAEITEGESRYVADTLGLRQVTWSATLAARAPDESQREFFKLARGAVVDLVQTCYDQSGEPFCVAVTVYPADRNVFQLTAGEFPLDQPSGDSR
jgi:GntR family transcriptional regulator